MKTQTGRTGITLLSLTSALDGGGRSTPRAVRFTPKKEIRYSMCRGLGWAEGTVWTGVEILAPNGIRSPDRPTRSELLYQILFQTGSRVFHIGLRSPQGLYVKGC